MAIIKRRGKRAASEPAALVAVVDQRLPATLPAEQSCADLYVRLYPKLFGVARRKVDRDSARDTINEVFLRLWQRWDRIAPEDRSEGPIVTAVRNQATDVARRDGKSVELTEDLAETGEVPQIPASDAGAQRDLAEVRDEILAQLSPRCREVYLMVNEDGFKYKQVAAALGIGHESVKTYLKRANILIREALTDGGYRIAAGESARVIPSSQVTPSEARSLQSPSRNLQLPPPEASND